MQYYDAQKNWRKVKRHVDHPDVQKILVRDFNKFTWGTWRQKFEPGMTPHEFESCDWWCDHRGPMPAYWHYVKHAACHWLVSFNLRLAEQVEPVRSWRIVTSHKHSTVWDGDRTLFDLNFLALGVKPNEAWQLARKQIDSEVLSPGKLLKVHLAQHWKAQMREHRDRIK